MKIRIVQQVYLVDKPDTFKNVYKEFDSSIIPHKGDFITDRAFKNPDEYEVHSISLDYDADLAQVLIHSVELASDKEESIKEYITMMKRYGWICKTI
nr:hypothetical protein [Tissierella sp.]